MKNNYALMGAVENILPYLNLKYLDKQNKMKLFSDRFSNEETLTVDICLEHSSVPLLGAIYGYITFFKYENKWVYESSLRTISGPTTNGNDLSRLSNLFLNLNELILQLNLERV